MTEAEYSLELAEGVSDVDEGDWSRLVGVGAGASVFLSHGFLTALEDAGCLGPKTGWIPRIPLLRKDGRLVAAAPAYVKLHSQGEFVYDWSWADFAQRVGVPYYPKLVVGVPFTPVTGRRILTDPAEDRNLLLSVFSAALVELTRAMKLSGVHVNFATEEEVQALGETGFLHRLGVQYHWYRHGEANFDAYLSRFNSKRRNQLKRERREVSAQGLHLENLRGGELTTKQIATAFRVYKSTVDKFVWGRQYLNRRVFELWAERLPEELEFVAAYDGPGRVVAGAVNFSSGRRLYGRYWGCFEERRHLHFNVCYYHGIQQAFDRQLDVFEPGQGGEHKLARGFEPTLMHSAHFLCEPRLYAPLSRYLEEERGHIRRERQAMLDAMGTKRPAGSGTPAGR